MFKVAYTHIICEIYLQMYNKYLCLLFYLYINNYILLIIIYLYIIVYTISSVRLVLLIFIESSGNFQVYLFTLEDNCIIFQNKIIIRFNSTKRTQKSSKMWPIMRLCRTGFLCPCSRSVSYYRFFLPLPRRGYRRIKDRGRIKGGTIRAASTEI